MTAGFEIDIPLKCLLFFRFTMQGWKIAALKEKVLPKRSHTLPGVAHTPPNTLTARTGVPLHRVTPVSRWVPLFDSPPTHTLALGRFLIPQA